jgi:solute carrier family 25 (mitochondrial ornithine transporter) member 2/15
MKCWSILPTLPQPIGRKKNCISHHSVTTQQQPNKTTHNRTVKVRMQTNPSVYGTVGGSVGSIFAQEGVTAFWKGAVPTCLGMIAENAMAFGVNEGLKRAFPTKEGETTSLLRPFWMGGLTGCCSALVLLPSEIVKAKLQVLEGSAGGQAGRVMKDMIQRQGYTSFMTGLDAQLARDASFYAVFFGGYELFVHLFRTAAPSMPDELNFFLSGGFAGMVGWACAMPVDVPKTNVQASYKSHVWGSFAPEFLRIARERGIGGLYSGIVPTLVRAFPANAALFLGVEMGKRAFDNYVWPSKPIIS